MLQRLMVVFCLCIICLGCHADQPLNFDINPTTAQMSLSDGTLKNANDCKVQIWDGKTKALVSLSLKNAVKKTAQYTEFSNSGGGLDVQNNIHPQGKVLLWEATVTNNRKEQAWLEVRFSGDFLSSAAPSFYNVVGLQEPAAKSIDGQTDRWPAMALWNGHEGFWIGTDPHQLFSLLTYHVEPKGTGNAKPFSFGARIVLDPGQSETVRFTFLPFAPREGHRSALQAYYDAFPDLFWPAPGIDPRFLTGGVAQGVSWRFASTTGDTSASEVPRRSSCTWDWMYGPFIFPGDAEMRKDRWNVIPAEHRGDRAQTWQQVEAFRAARQKYFYNTDILYNVAAGFYTIDWAHEDLVKKLWPDSPMTEDMGWEKRPGSQPGWISKKRYVKSGPWNTIEIFPWGTSAGDAFKQDYADLAKSPLNFTGFTYDSNVNGGTYRGPKVNTLPGRAWDDKGVFVGEGVGQALMADYIHSLHKGGYRMAVVANQPASYYGSTFRIDAFMLELNMGSLFTRNGGIIAREYTRAQVGHKSRNLYGHYSVIARSIRLFRGWEKMMPQQIHDVMNAAHDRILIYALAYGWNLYPDMVMPDARMQHFAPIVAYLVEKGWQPESGMSDKNGKTNLYRARYGNDVESYLTLGNNSADTQRQELLLDTNALTQHRIFYSSYEGAAVPMQYQNNTGHFAVEMKPHDVLVLRSVLALDGGAGTLIGKAARIGDAHAGQITVDINASALEKTKAQLVLPNQMTLDALILNGAPVKEISSRNNILSFPLSLNAGDNHLIATYHSLKVLSPVQTILNFPFLDQKSYQSAAQIVLPQNADDMQKTAAFRLSEYFRYWSAMNLKKEIHLPIVTVADPKIPYQILMGNSDDLSRQGIGVKGKVLSITGKVDRDTATLLNQLMKILDQKYTVIAPFTNQVNYPKRPLIGNSIPASFRKTDPWIPQNVAKGMEEIFRKGDIWNKPLRLNLLPAGESERSKFLDLTQVASQQKSLLNAATSKAAKGSNDK